MTTEDDFQTALDAHPEDWNTRLVFADWLQDRGDPRSTGYRAIAVQRLRPLSGTIYKRSACWWHCKPDDTFHNIIPRDWFALLPAGQGNNVFWPLVTETRGVKSRRECEDALARAFAQLPDDRQAALLKPLQQPDEPKGE